MAEVQEFITNNTRLIVFIGTAIILSLIMEYVSRIYFKENIPFIIVLLFILSMAAVIIGYFFMYERKKEI